MHFSKKCKWCEGYFYGRPNRDYCPGQPCKKKAENARARFRILVDRIARTPDAIEEAEQNRDFHEKRYLEARCDRDCAEMEVLVQLPAVKDSPDLDQAIYYLELKKAQKKTA